MPQVRGPNLPDWPLPWRRAMWAASLMLAAGCTPSARPTVREPVLARRLVLALDGIDYRDIVAARERGLFAPFREPHRLVSTFPSISDIAWHEVFGILPPKGYQRLYFSLASQSLVGSTLDAIKPIEFEDRMDMAFDAKFHHLGAYLISNTIARREVDVDVRDFFKISGRPTVYAYNVGPDALQHTNGDLEGYLRHLDRQLVWLMDTYRQRTGRDLEIVIMSDHGHNKSPKATFLPIDKTLRANGFRVASDLRASTDVAFSVDGVSTGFGVFCHPDSVATVARVLAWMTGVELVTLQQDDSTFGLLRERAEGLVRRRRDARGDRYRYEPVRGDPLGYAALLDRMAREGALDADGYADADTWVRYSSAAELPVAPVRIVQGHTTVTLNPAPILVSVLRTHRIGLGLASITDRIFSLGGTHGALSASSSLGVLMTNFTDVRDDITTSVRRQLDEFDDLGDVHFKKSGARLGSTWVAQHDPRGPFHGVFADSPMGVAGSVTPRFGAGTLEVFLTPADRDWLGPSGSMHVDVRQSRLDHERDNAVVSRYVPVARFADQVTDAVLNGGVRHGAANGIPNGEPLPLHWRAGSDGRHFVLPWNALVAASLQPRTSYRVRVALDRAALDGIRPRSGMSRMIADFVIKTNAAGEIWPY